MINTTKLGDLVVAEDNKTIITRIQNRRGLKQDLPQPLRPGELGFATDTRQLYIGADTAVTTDSFNKTAKFENIIGAKTVTTDLVDDQIVYFTVPHRRYNRNDFDGTVTTVSWTPTSNKLADNSSTDTVFKAGETEFRHLQLGGPFDSRGVAVVKNGVALTGDTSLNASHTNISSGADFFFTAGTDVTSAHKISFRTPPVQRDEIGVTYYGNTQVWTAITAKDDNGNAVDVGTGGIGVTGVNGFHAGYNIPSYRELAQKNIRVSASSGVGYIGLSPKHITVATDVKRPLTTVATPNTIPYGQLGTVLVSRNIQKTASSAMTVAGTTATITVGTENIGNFSVSGGFVLANLVSGTGWIDGKVLDVTSLSATEVNAAIPSNSAVVTKGVTSITDYSSGDLTFIADNVQNVQVNDDLYFIDSSNVANLNTKVATVVSVNSSSKVVSATVAGVDNNDWENASDSLKFITRKAGAPKDIVITSSSHGFDTGEEFTTTNGDIGVGNIPVSSPTTDTFVVTTNNTITSNVGFVITPVVTNASVYVTPVTGIDISSNTSLTQAVTYFNENVDAFEMRYPPQIENAIYLTEKEAVTKSSSGFRVFDDEKRTATYLGIIPDNYTKENSTVKAKLENWLFTMLNDADINMFKSIAINEPYSSNPFDTWNIVIDSATDEVRFTSSEEARNFSTVVNNIYFDSQSNDIRGLLNVKTNIEILTLESQESGDSDAIFTAPKGADIPSSATTVITDLEANVQQYDAVFIEYSMQDKSANTSTNYKRIGTLHITGEHNSNTAIIQDNFTDSRSGYTGNVSFVANYDPVSATVEVSAENTLSPGTDVRLTFIRRSWSTL